MHLLLLAKTKVAPPDTTIGGLISQSAIDNDNNGPYTIVSMFQTMSLTSQWVYKMVVKIRQMLVQILRSTIVNM